MARTKHVVTRVALVVLAAVVLSVAQSTTAFTVPSTRTLTYVRGGKGRTSAPSSDAYDQPTTSEVDSPEDVPIIGGPETVGPDPEVTQPPEDPVPEPEPTAAPKPATSPVTTAPTTKPSSAVHKPVTPRPAPRPTAVPVPSTAPPSTTSRMPTPVPFAAKPTPSAPPSPSFRGTSTPPPEVEQVEHVTQPPQPQQPQALEFTPQRHDKSWPLMVLVASIAGVGIIVALVLWRGTRHSNRRASVPEQSIQTKTASGDLEFDWYASSPNLSSSVDTFMGRQPVRNLSDMSSRPESTADLLNVSSTGDRSTASNPSSRSQSIPVQADVEESSRGAKRLSDEARERTSSSPRVSFDDEVNALSDTVFNKVFGSRPSTEVFPTSGSELFSPTSTDGGNDFASDDGSGDEEDERQFSTGSYSTAILGECSFISSTHSDWGDATTVGSE